MGDDRPVTLCLDPGNRARDRLIGHRHVMRIGMDQNLVIHTHRDMAFPEQQIATLIAA